MRWRAGKGRGSPSVARSKSTTEPPISQRLLCNEKKNILLSCTQAYDIRNSSIFILNLWEDPALKHLMQGLRGALLGFPHAHLPLLMRLQVASSLSIEVRLCDLAPHYSRWLLFLLLRDFALED